MFTADDPPSRKTVWTRAGRLLAKGVSYVLNPETASQFKVEYQQVYVDNLPDAFESFRVVQLSDIHFYELGCSRYYQRVIDAVNALAPDLIVATGDIIHYGASYLAYSQSFLRQLEAPWGKWSCMGNHDYSDDHKGAALQEMMQASGFQVLVNDAAALEKEGKRLWISGVDDLLKGAPDPCAVSGKVEAGNPHLCLVHNPRLAPLMDVSERPPQLILAGHTHGGQIKHPFVNWMQHVVFKQPYQYGWFTFNRSKLYVTSGVGSAVVSWHVPPHFEFALYPFRINTLPEIAVFDLTGVPMVGQPLIEVMSGQPV